jgi:hypothetical protein
MAQIQDLFSIVDKIAKSTYIQSLAVETQNLSKISRTYQTNSSAAVQQTIPILDRIIKILSGIEIGTWAFDNELIAEKLDIKGIVGENGRQFIENIKTQIQNNPATGTSLINSVITELNKLRTKPIQLASLLQPFVINTTLEVINKDEGIIEITFDGKVSITDFKEAKDQMNDWFLTIEGYARILDERREDFEIIGISKSSPAKFKIKTKLKNVALVVSIVTNLLMVEKTVLENRLMIQKLKEQILTNDVDLQRKFIEEAEKNINVKINEGIDRIVNDKMKEYNIAEGEGDVRNNFAKSVQNQYNFVINGGNIDIHVIGGELKQEVQTLEKTKVELKQIKEAYENQKALKSGE